ncbi:MAG: hypothetical protein ABSB60_08745 [Terracidiphilus sp.]|jgi:hypothetical protein
MNDASNPRPTHALANSPESVEFGQPATGFQRAAGALRAILPHLLRLLPLLDGNVGSAVSNLLNPSPPPQAPGPPVDLTTVEDGLAELQAGQRDLREQMIEQNAAVMRVEERLETMEEAIARNALAQQELLKEVRILGASVNELRRHLSKAKLLAIAVLGLLALSILVNVFWLVRFRPWVP